MRASFRACSGVRTHIDDVRSEASDSFSHKSSKLLKSLFASGVYSTTRGFGLPWVTFKLPVSPGLIDNSRKLFALISIGSGIISRIGASFLGGLSSVEFQKINLLAEPSFILSELRLDHRLVAVVVP